MYKNTRLQGIRGATQIDYTSFFLGVLHFYKFLQILVENIKV